ncbi:MAG TPA: phosphate ABC transporter permease subunit PstC [Bryobacteraceae bacterium]|nr:phosphate ABC transporter permease subunit PstC [Bryobacteraceae bacterium]
MRDGDQVTHLITLIFAASVFLITVLLVYELWIRCGPSRGKFGLAFFFTQIWDPNAEQFGALPFIYGTVVTSFVALLISVPLGVGAAIYLAELASPRWSNVFTFLIELLAAVPSVIFGLLAIFTIVPLMRDYVEPGIQNVLGFLPVFSGPIYGVGFLTASLTLAVMIFPYIISISRESLMAVPREQREAALALGATKWESTYQVVLPYARLGIIGSVFLALARALGETMAVTMVIGNTPKISPSLFAPGYSIAAVIANEFTEATGDMYLSALVELGLVLFLLTMIINAGAQLLIVATAGKGTKH